MKGQLSDMNASYAKSAEDLIRTLKQDYESHSYKFDSANARMMDIELDNHKVLQ